VLSSKPLLGYRCMACDRPLPTLDERPGPYIPAGRMPPPVPSGQPAAVGGIEQIKVRALGGLWGPKGSTPQAQGSRDACHPARVPCMSVRLFVATNNLRTFTPLLLLVLPCCRRRCHPAAQGVCRGSPPLPTQGGAGGSCPRCRAIPTSAAPSTGMVRSMGPPLRPCLWVMWGPTCHPGAGGAACPGQRMGAPCRSCPRVAAASTTGRMFV
jgi:hypothetical protein